jgi:hypothetical protein
MNQYTEAPSGKAQATNRSENEGGAVEPIPSPVLPEGITAVTFTQYRVGPYRYSSLDDALAEHRRQSEAG